MTEGWQGTRWRLWPVAGLRMAGLPWANISLVDAPDGEEGPAAALASDEWFAQALTWQNPAVAQNWLLAYRARLRAGKDVLPRRSQRQTLLATYLQRYVAKNDTIGFFGPVGWAAITAGDGVSSPSERAQHTRTAHIEPWFIRAAIATSADDPELADRLPLRRSPAVHWNGSSLLVPPGRVLTPTPAEGAILDAVTNLPVRGDLVRFVARSGVFEEGEVRQAVANLVYKGVLMPGPQVPMDGRPERALDGLPEPWISLRDEIAEVLDDAVRASDAEAVADVLARADCMVNAWAPGIIRNKQRMPIGRTPVYIDEGWGVLTEIGADLLDIVRDPLEIVLDAAAWLAHEVGAAVLREAERVFVSLALAGAARLDALVAALAPVLSGTDDTAVAGVLQDFQARWDLLTGGLGEGDLHLNPADVAGVARALFPARTPLWVGATQHSPDLLLAQTERGPQWVLGELHVAVNTLENAVFYRQHRPGSVRLDDLTRQDFPFGRVVSCFSADDVGITPRTWPPLSSASTEYRYWALSASSALPEPPAQVTAATAIRVVRDPVTGLRADAPEWSAPLLEVLGDSLSVLAVNLFQPVGPADRCGRLTLGELVVRRATWMFDPRTLLEAAGQCPARLPEVLRSHGVPTLVFVTSAAEPKPLFIDVNSEHFRYLLLRVLARAGDSPVTLTEMYPGPTELWCDPDGRGVRTSEFRFVAVPIGHGSSPWTGHKE